MCATTLRTPSVVPRSQHVLRSYCWQNVKPRFFEGGLPCARKSGYPACDTHVGALDLAATPARDTARRVATSDRARIVPRSVMLPRAVILSRGPGAIYTATQLMREATQSDLTRNNLTRPIPSAIAIPRFRDFRESQRMKRAYVEYVTPETSISRGRGTSARVGPSRRTTAEPTRARGHLDARDRRGGGDSAAA